MTKFCATVVGLLILLPGSLPGQDPSTIRVLAGVTARYGIAVHHDFERNHFFPPEWRKAPVNATGTRISPKELDRLAPIIALFLGRYPVPVVKRNLRDIYLFSDMRFFGKPYGGTNSTSALYVASQGENRGYSNLFLAGTLHHEFSSILLRGQRARFPTRAWKTANPSGFAYDGTGVEMLGRPNLLVPSPRFLEQGFLTRYSQSSLENDFNMIAGWMFTRPAEIRDFGERYPRIRKKLELAVSFYEALHSGFDFNDVRPLKRKTQRRWL